MQHLDADDAKAVELRRLVNPLDQDLTRWAREPRRAIAAMRRGANVGQPLGLRLGNRLLRPDRGTRRGSWHTAHDQQQQDGERAIHYESFLRRFYGAALVLVTRGHLRSPYAVLSVDPALPWSRGLLVRRISSERPTSSLKPQRR